MSGIVSLRQTDVLLLREFAGAARPNLSEMRESVSTCEKQIRAQRTKYGYGDAGEYR
jgi:hypothetical protein